MRTNLTRLAFIQADNDDRLKRALASRINAHDGEFFQNGDLISFKEEDENKWAGPAKVIGIDGKVLIVKYGNNTRRVHKSKAVKQGKEFRIQARNVDIKDEEESNKTEDNKIEEVQHGNNEVESEVERISAQTRSTRQSSRRRPENKRRI